MATEQTKEWRLKSHLDVGTPTLDLFELVDVDVEPLTAGTIRLQLVVVSVDPYLRGAMRTPSPDYYGTSWVAGKAPFSFVVARITESAADGFAAGDVVRCIAPWRLNQVVVPPTSTVKVNLDLAPPQAWVGVLGLTGLSAWLPIDEIAKPKAGEFAFVSGAAGAVGSAACQIMKAAGVKVIGSAGSDEKVEKLRALGVAAFNYKAASTLDELRAFAPDGLDIYFDNVGGKTLDDTLLVLRKHGRVVCCGQISQYNLPPEERHGLKNVMNIVTKSLTLRGFIVSDWQSRFGEATEALTKLLHAGELECVATVLEGFEAIPEAFLGLFTGRNTGKMVVAM